MVKVYGLRHSQTFFNAHKKQLKEDCEANKLSEREAVLRLRRPEFIDSDLTPHGVATTEAFLRDNKELLSSIKYVVVSPMFRTLQSAHILFGEKLLDENRQLIVHKGLRSGANNLYSVPHRVEDPAGQFPAFDFKNLSPADKAFNFEWFIDEVEDEAHKNRLKEIAEKSRGLDKPERLHLILDYLEKAYPAYLEDRATKMRRCQDFKKWLRSFIADNKVKDGELLLISHASILKRLKAEKFDEEGRPVKVGNIDNTQLISMDIEF